MCEKGVGKQRRSTELCFALEGAGPAVDREKAPSWVGVHVKSSQRQENMGLVMLKWVLRMLEVNRILSRIVVCSGNDTCVCSGTTMVVWDFLAAAVLHS